MKSLIFAGLFVISGLSQADELYSKDVKKNICAEISYQMEEDFHVNQFDHVDCWKGQFEVTKTRADQASHEVTLLNVKFAVEQKNMTIYGTAEAVRVFQVLSDGNIKRSWSARKVKINVNDNRAPGAIIEELFEDLSFGNGDAGISKKPSSFSKEDMIKDIEKALPNEEEEDSCTYITSGSDEWALSDLSEHTDEIPAFIKELKKQGKVRGVVSRIYDEGESEYCSHYYFRILLNDGTYIYIDLDFTT